jgi:hypothetical protein
MPAHDRARVVVKKRFTISVREPATRTVQEGLTAQRKPSFLLQNPFVADRASALDAARLMTELGDEAAAAVAAGHAEVSRDRGNVVHFCRWRQIERLIVAMADPQAEQTRH